MPGEESQTASLTERAADLKLGAIRRHIFLCADQTKPKCCTREAGIEAWDYLKRRLGELGMLDRVYRTRANCLRICEERTHRASLPGRNLVSPRGAGSAGTYHSAAFDRRARGGRPCLRAKPGMRRMPGIHSSAASSGGSNESSSSGFRAKRFKTRMISPLRNPARARRR